MSNHVGNILLKKGILLESGTNEVEVLVFRVGSYRLGINVAKVREILPSQSITSLPQSHPSVVGCCRLRDAVVPCVSLHRHLNQSESPLEQSNLILTEFNRSQIAFIVDAVERIHRISWERISPVPSVVAEVGSPITAVTQIDDTLVSMLDLELISSEISQENPIAATVDNPLNVPREQLRILIVDDSITVRSTVETTLRNSGYVDIQSFEHGGLAWEWIQKTLRETGDVSAVADLVVSDVEMPSMDGLHLTQNIKQHPQLSNLPVILFSSILTPDNLKKGESVGADAQITKPELDKVVTLADGLIMKHRSAAPEQWNAPGDLPAPVGLTQVGSTQATAVNAASPTAQPILS